jgi:glycosyltransferase involved in cell wall biosynthesis
MRLRVPSACQPNCPLCDGPLPSDGDVLRAMLTHAQQTDQLRVYLQGTDLVRDARLQATIQVARSYSRQAALVEDGRGLDLPGAARSLSQMGIDHVYLSLPVAPAPSHEKTRDAWKQALAVLLGVQRTGHLQVGVHLPLTQRSATQIVPLLRLQAKLAVGELLISEATSTDGALDATAAVAALERVWLAANTARVHLRVMGFERTRYVNAPIGQPAPVCDRAFVEIIRQKIPLASSRAGVHALGVPDRPSALTQVVRSPQELRTLGLELAARRCPFVDLPPCLGGVQLTKPTTSDHQPTMFTKSDACRTCTFDARCPGAPERAGATEVASLRSVLRPLPTWYAFGRSPRVLLLMSEGGDPLTYASTLPALAEALRRRGAAVEIVSPWLSGWNPDVLSLDSRGACPHEWMGTKEVEHWIGRHGLDGFDLVIASDFAAARVALAAGSLHPAARIVVVDFHMLEGMDQVVAAWRKTAGREHWWPSEQLILQSAFPAYLKLYLNYGVPIEHIVWHPFSLYPGHFSPGPDVSTCDVIFSGGDHLRDIGTLRTATERLPTAVHVVDLYAFGEPIEGNARLRFRGSLPLQSFYSALANSRFVVLPLEEDTNRAAGVTVLAMALMAGRPLVATGTAAVRDYVCDGVEALLVPPGDPAALADAITRLDTDSARLSTLAEGARRAGARLSTEHWAEQIVSGDSPLGPIWTSSGWRTW